MDDNKSIYDFVRETSAKSREALIAAAQSGKQQEVIPVIPAVPVQKELVVEGKAAPVFKAAKVVADKSDPTIIIGIGAVAGNLDLDGEELSVKAMTDMAHDFCSTKNKRTFKANHENEIACELVESFIGCPIYELTDGSLKVVKALDAVPDGATFAGISNSELSHWFIGVKPADQSLVAKAAAGELAFSWAAYCEKETVAD